MIDLKRYEVQRAKRLDSLFRGRGNCALDSAGQRDNVIHRADMLTHVATIASATDLPVSAQEMREHGTFALAEAAVSYRDMNAMFLA